jgi:hypothetical protein
VRVIPESKPSRGEKPVPTIIDQQQLIDEILDQHRENVGEDIEGYAGYRGHVYRVFNLARALAGEQAGHEAEDKLAVAAAFHDLEVFRGLDYLAGSIRAQDAWLTRTGRQAWGSELAVIVAHHHRLTPYRGVHAALTEPFRRADLVDLSAGLVRFGLSPDYVRSVRRAFDVGPFFTRTIPRAILRQLAQRPADPVPVLRSRRALMDAGHMRP